MTRAVSKRWRGAKAGVTMEIGVGETSPRHSFRGARAVAESATPGEHLNAEKWIRDSYPAGSDGERIATSMLAALEPSSWRALPVHDEGRPPRPLLAVLVHAILDTQDTIRMFRGPTKKVNHRQINSVRSQAKALAASLRDLPPGVRHAMAEAARISEVDGELLPKLDLLSHEARRWQRGERQQVSYSLRSAKVDIENALAYKLALHGVELVCTREKVLDNVLVVGYEELGIKAGRDTMRTMMRLKAQWSPDAVRAYAEQARPRWKDYSAWVGRLPPLLSARRR